MKTFITQYGAMRFALDRQDRRRRGQHGFLASLLLALGQILVIALLLPIAGLQLLGQIGREVRKATADPNFKGTFVSGRPPRAK